MTKTDQIVAWRNRQSELGVKYDRIKTHVELLRSIQSQISLLISQGTYELDLSKDLERFRVLFDTACVHKHHIQGQLDKNIHPNSQS